MRFKEIRNQTDVNEVYQETSYKIKVVLMIRNERNCDEVKIKHCMSEYQEF